MSGKRGAFLVLEGCDRTGKSTQSRLLVECLKQKNVPVVHKAFPARNTRIGAVIDSYLRNNQELPDEGIHLLFSANRWELINEIRKLMELGTTIVVDRYSYSGVAYSAAKGLEFNWCMASEKGLLRPDIVFYLKPNTKSLIARGDFGKERYESLEFQEKVAEVYEQIYKNEKSYWHLLNADLPIEEITAEISSKAMDVIKQVESKAFLCL